MLQNLVKHCKNKNELEALALSANNPRAIFFTTDTNSIILGGKIFGIGNSLLFIGTQSEYNAAILAGQIPYGTIVIIEDSYLTFTALGDNCSIGFYNNPDATISPTIEYSFDKNNWAVLTDKVSIEKDCLMYCRGINPDGINRGYDNMYELGGYYNYFTGEGKFNVSGDIMSLINYETPPKTMVGTFCNIFGGNGASLRDNFVDIVDASKLVLSAKTLTNGCYANMFVGCTSLTTAPEILPATTLTPDCYIYMFAFCPSLTTAPILPATALSDMCYAFMFYCTSITTAPELPATKLTMGCYGYMFAGCISLTDAPELHATELADACYAGMFVECISLTTAPELPATLLSIGCYSGMFSYCESLLNAPELPATTLTPDCYSSMFEGCTSLTAAPTLSATELADYCYMYMFEGCTSLTVAPELPATTLTNNCYESMFSGCTLITAAPTLSATTLADYCYSYMFSGCSSLTTAPVLPATTLADYCYSNMFQGCTSLNSVPTLPATELVDYCYSYMFEGCTDLTTLPTLPATELADYCYSYMFQNCTSITTTPELPATTLAEGCYYNMFNGCISITAAPTLPAVVLAYSCYQCMFLDCTSLTTAPELPATTLTDYCYNCMFLGCTSLTTAPVLLATTLTYGCYNAMFQWCTNLNHITCLATTVPYYCTDNWVYGVANSGGFVKHPDADWPTNISGIPSGWTVEDALMSYVTFTAELDGSSIGLEKLSNNHTLEYSTNSFTWETFNTETNISLNNEDKVYIRGILGAAVTPPTNYTQFKMDGKIAASGNCNAIWNYEDLEAPLKSYCGYYMFQNCTALTVAPELPAMVLADGCYSNMFHSCTSLIKAPELPATTLADSCYSSMFYNCTSLAVAPMLPAATLDYYCYGYMFYNCTNLSHITCLATDKSALSCTNNWVSGVSSTGIFFKHPDMTNWTTDINGIPSGWTIEDMKYVAFTAKLNGSSIGLAKLSTNQTLEYITDTATTWNAFDKETNISLNKGDKVYVRGILSADNTTSNYTQFKMTGKIAASGNCNAIWNYQNLNAPLKAHCGYYMFNSCKSLITAPELPATVLSYHCYDLMFNDTSLTSAPELPAITLAAGCYEAMFRGCTSLIKAPELPATTLAYSCYRGMFTSCRSLTISPALLATTLADYCYDSMFYGCTSLVAAPELPATTLVKKCYNSMFTNCTSLTTAPELPATTLTNNCYAYMFNGCANLNYIKCLATDISADWCTSNWVTDVSSTGMFFKHQDMTNWTTGINGIPSGWAVKDPYTPQECVTLEITADNVSARKTNTTIYYTATTNGIYDNGDIVEGRIITGTATSDEFEQNKSYTDTVERTITFEFMGVTATTTIIQDIWKDQLCDVVLNNQWRLSETQSNPDSTLYDGVYESFSNKDIHHGTATMYLDLYGYTEFDVYIRCYAEPGYDYVTISEPNSTTEKANTKDNQNNGQDINSYTKVHYDNLTGNDRITIIYIKDGSGTGGNDQGYILIPKQ